jgi:hypothetical protein
MSDGFGGHFASVFFWLLKTWISASPVCESIRIGDEHRYFSAFSKFFDYSNGSGMSFLPHALQYFEWMPFSAWQCLQIYILFNEIVLTKWETI